MADPTLVSEGVRDAEPGDPLLQAVQPSQQTSPVTPGPKSHAGEEQALESHEVIELQTFSDRKAWIEEKIKFLESLPPIEVFAGLDAVRSSSEDVTGLPTREELQQWMAEHDAIEKETEIFDKGELAKLRQLTKAATQRNLSTEDTDVIELTLTTIYALDKLLHLLRDRSENLEMMSIRLTWEENRQNSWKERRQIMDDLNTFATGRACWSPSIYAPNLNPQDSLSRRSSITSQASASSDNATNSLTVSRSARFKLAELLSRDAAQFSAKISGLRHGKVTAAGKALDKLIDHSRKPVPEELLDEQDRLEEKCINELENVGKFAMNLVMQWRKADEIHVETMKDHAAASNLLEEIETARLYHPTARQSTSFSSRIDTILKRLAIRGDPASPVSLFPRPEHPLFPEQKAANDSLIKLLSTDIANANQLARKVDLAAKDYRASHDAVKRVETLIPSVKEVSTALMSIHKKYEEGITSSEGDGSPPNLDSEKCLDPTSHSVFFALLPSLFEETNLTIDEADVCLKAAPSALLGLNIQGIDQTFKENASSDVKVLFTVREDVIRTRDDVSERIARLRESRRISSEIDTKLTYLNIVSAQIKENMSRDRWQQESGGTGAPPAPESPSFALSTCTTNQPFETQLLEIGAKLKSDINDPLEMLCATLESPLQAYLKGRFSELCGSLDTTLQLLRLLGLVREQSLTMNSIRDSFHDILTRMEDTKIHFNGLIEDVLASQENIGLDTSGVTVDLEPMEQEVTAFIDSLMTRVPFVAKHTPSATTKRANLTKPNSPSIFGEFDVHGGLPFDVTSLDVTVRSDSNAYAMRLNGNMENLRKEKRHFELAVKARTVDFSLLPLIDEINGLASKVLSQKTSMSHTLIESDGAIDHLKLILDGISVLRSTRSGISRLMSPIQQLLWSMDETSSNLDPAVREKLFTSRVRAVDDAESQIKKWDENIETFKDQLSFALQSARRYQEELRLAAKQKKKEEEDRIAAEEAERLRMEKERLKNEERERVQLEKLAEERRQQLERERIASELAEEERLVREAAAAERLRLEEQEKQAETARIQAEQERLAKGEAERLRLEQERLEMAEKLRVTEAQLEEERRLTAEGDLAKQKLLEMEVLTKQQRAEIQRLAEEQAKLKHGEERKNNEAKDVQGPGTFKETLQENGNDENIVIDDVFGSYNVTVAPKSQQSQEFAAIQAQLFSLRKRLRSIAISEVLHPSTGSGQAHLPTMEQRNKLHHDLSLIFADFEKLTSTTTDNHLHTEFTSFRVETSEASKSLHEVHRLAYICEAVQSCDAALSDLLEHIDSYPAVPLSILSSTHRSAPNASPEEQLSTRLSFTEGIIDKLTSKSAAFSNDSRVSSEHARILQTWKELREMSDDRLGGQGSRSTSAMSRNNSRTGDNAGMSSKPPVNRPPLHARSGNKTGSYSHLSVSSVSVKGNMLAPPQTKPRRVVSGTNDQTGRSTSRLSTTSTRSVSGPGPLSASIYGSTFASRQRTTSLSHSTATPSRRTSQPSQPPVRSVSRQRLNSETRRSKSPAMSESSAHSRTSLAPRSSTTKSTWSRAPRDSISSMLLPRIISPPNKKSEVPPRKKYVADPKSKLDVAVGEVINQLPVGINIEGITESWRDQSGKYWIGNQDPKLCFCRILRSQTVMVRVGGGWTELSKFIKDHFADSFRIAPESPPRLGSQAEKWISSATLLEAQEPSTPPRTPEPQGPFVPSFSLLTPSGQSPQSLKSSPSTKGSPLAALQYIRRADPELSTGHSTGMLRPATPSKPPLRGRNLTANTPARTSVWRP
ncbi:hypothetical protein CPB84DRAFT_1777177 [Gymnopilus junonius]|uniref:GAR domain-containing protein n=1 Tax=Gymnopilus junonius TaxID=109634 RepID=A0A9P5TML8_GYMJU|nr:hypothetical protein CPB84DRAFT_1777177 [Gymnopilus junonius]